MPEDDRDLAARFEELKQLLFPDFDWRGWKVQEGTPPNVLIASGYCDDEGRTVWIDCFPDEYTRTLVHEMVHASRGIEGHDDPFLEALDAVADRAATIERRDLEAEIRSERTEWARGESVRARAIYDDVEAAMRSDIDFDAALQKVAPKYRDMGPLEPADLLTQYPRLRTLRSK